MHKFKGQRDETYFSHGIYGSWQDNRREKVVEKAESLLYRPGLLYRRALSQGDTPAFAEKGEEAFRDIERRMLHEVASFEDVLVSTGGGTPCFFDNIDFMNKAGTTVYLKVSVDELANRLEVCKQTRPVLRNRNGKELRQFIGENLESRRPFYEKAQIIFDAERMMTGQDVQAITDQLTDLL